LYLGTYEGFLTNEAQTVDFLENFNLIFNGRTLYIYRYYLSFWVNSNSSQRA
jgi:hypothetical protein